MQSMAKRMAKQMELFEPVERGFDEGGLMDEGGMVDEESGNEVPPGSLREEVRDDISAQLSEGEFVFPADVVRYIGLENLMRMRQEAKQGLAQMEAMGQMGNGDEAVMPDDLPFDMYDLDVDDEEEYNSETRNYQVGGYVPPSVPQQPYNQPTQVNPQTGTYTLPGTGIAGYQVPSGTPTGYTPYGGAQPYFQPVQFTGPQYQTALQTTNLPTFAETVGSKPGQYDELRTYVNDAGQILQIPFKDGQPIYPIPEGYRLQGDKAQTEETPATITPTTGVRQEDDGGRDDVTTTPTTSTRSTSLSNLFGGPDYYASPGVMSISGRDLIGTAGQKNNMYGGSAKYGFSNEALRNSTFELAGNQINSTSPILGAAKAIGDKLGLDTNNISFNRHAIAGNTARADALNFLGLAGTNQLDYMNNDLASTVVGTAMEKAMAASKVGKNPTEAFNDYMSSAEAMQARNEVYDAIKDSFASDGVPSQMGVLGLGDYNDRDFARDLADLANDAKNELDNLGPEVMDSKPGKNNTTHQSFISRDFNNLDENGNPKVGYHRNRQAKTTANYLNSTIKQVESLREQAIAKEQERLEAARREADRSTATAEDRATVQAYDRDRESGSNRGMTDSERSASDRSDPRGESGFSGGFR